MRKKALIFITAALLAPLTAIGQSPDTLQVNNVEEVRPAVMEIEFRDTVSNAFLDTVKLDTKLKLNDYAMIGVNYGMGRAQCEFNPAKTQGSLKIPRYFGITFTKYGKFFGYMPYFGYQIGLFYGQDGYKFKENKDGYYSYTVDGATSCTYDFVEVPFVAQFHVDTERFKILIDAGMYAGYRYKIHREGPFKFPELMDDFTDYEYKWDYGFKAAAGFGLVFSPLELHIKLNMRYGLGSLYRADYNDREYYRFAYPFDLILTVGLHYQLGRRTGRTKSDLKREARRIVYGD